MNDGSNATMTEFCQYVISETQPNWGNEENNQEIPEKLIGYSKSRRIFAQSNQNKCNVMKGHRYYENLDFSKPIGTHRYVDNIKSRRELAKVALVAMARINQAEQGGNHLSL